MCDVSRACEGDLVEYTKDYPGSARTNLYSNQNEYKNLFVTKITTNTKITESDLTHRERN
jgi:hypothetical protein